MSITNESNINLLSIDKPASLNWSIADGVPGSMDGIILNPGGSKWRHKPNDSKKLKGKVFVPSGTPLPLKSEEMYHVVPDNSMFMFSQNISRPECCPSTYSSSGGCICSTKQQREFVAQKRGNNKNYSNYSF